MTAEIPESTKARVRTLGTSTPERAAARGLPPAAKICLPKVVRCSRSTAATPTTTRMITE